MVTGSEIFGWMRLGARALVIHPAQLAWRGEPGAERFRENFLPEGLVPTTMADRELLRGASRCIGCRLCDSAAQGEQAEGHAPFQSPRGDGPRPSLVPLVFSRSSVELVEARTAVTALRSRPALLAEGERRCPTGVPLVRLGAWLDDRLRRVDAAKDGVP